MVRKESLSGQRFACDRPGCGKHYSRPDHLLRHKLNHDREKVLACDQCDRTFVRQDLLARHLERHALRGRTLGRWSGRHADGEGSIGPSGGRRRRRRSQRRHGEDDDDDDDDDIDIDGDDDDMDDDDEFDDMSRQAREAMEMENLHPAIRQSSGNGFGTYDGNAGLSTMPTADRYDQTPFAYAPPPASTGQQYGYASDSVGSSQSIAPPLPYEASYEISSAPSQQLAPNFSYGRTLPSRGQQAVWETQSNSAMQTAPAYTARSSSVTHPDWSSSAPSYVPPSPIASFPANNLPLATGAAAAAFPSTPETTSDTMALLHTSVPGSSHFPFSAPSTNDYVADYDWLFDGTNPLNAAQSTHTTEEGSTTFSEHSPKKEGPGAQEEGLEQTNALLPASAATGSPSSDDEVGRASRSGAGEQADALHDLAFFAILQRNIPEEAAFDVDQKTAVRLVHFLSSVSELATSPLFTPAALRCYLHLFFTRVNAIYPLIHQPTFSAKAADPMLLSAMVVCGAHFADEAAHFLAERVGRKLWGAFISFEDFRPARATLAMLQAMLITETFGKMMGTRPQHETAHLFHNFIVTLARRNAVFIQSKAKLPSASPEERWRAWAREEEKKRISFYSFVLDAQHATIFRHIPALSSFQIHLQLPCDDDEWEAKTAAEWSTIRQSKRCEPPNFIAALKASLTPDHATSAPLRDNGFKQFVLLHGLMSVAYDLQWKQQALLAAPDTSESISNWKERLMISYGTCKQHLDSKQAPSLMDQAALSLIEWAQIVLHVDAVDIQIYAGLPTIMGRFIDHHTFSIARKSCREWAKTDDARVALWHAARFLQATILPATSSDENSERPSVTGVDVLLHHQWVQYLSSLIIWGYEQASAPAKLYAASRPRSRDEPDMEGSAPLVQEGALQHQTTLQTALGKRVPDEGPPLDKTTREASAYLAYVSNASSQPDDDEDFDPPRLYSIAVLELVEKECRGSRWELGREASGVLRKLIHERKSQTQQSSSALEQQSPVASQRAEANTANSSLKTVPTANNTIDDTLTSSQSTTLGHLKGEGESVSN